MVYKKILEGMTVRLRSVELKDAEITYQMRSHPEKSSYIHKAAGTVVDQRAYIERQREREGDYFFLIENRKNEPIGMKGLYGHDPLNSTIESGRFMGFGTQIENMEALYLSFGFAFNVLGVERINMSVLELNTAMYGIQQKFGARELRRKYNPEFGCNDIDSVLTREAYEKYGEKINRLIKRFAERNQ